MKILGISGSPRKDGTSGVFTLVKTVLENTGLEYELISLRGKKIGGCIACLGCAKDNICKVKDDMTDLRDKIGSADAYVIGAPNYYSMLNGLTHAFLERWFQFVKNFHHGFSDFRIYAIYQALNEQGHSFFCIRHDIKTPAGKGILHP